MVTFESILSAAQQLSADDRQRLIDALWDMEPHDSEEPLDPALKEELDRRWAELEANPSLAIPWETVRAELFAKARRNGAG